MKKFILYLTFIFLITVLQAQRPKNIRIFNVKDKSGTLYYEYTVFKNEIFALQFVLGRGTGYYWKHLNDSLLKEPKIIELLNMTTYFYGDYIDPITEIIHFIGSNETQIVVHRFPPISGGSEEYYETYKV